MHYTLTDSYKFWENNHKNLKATEFDCIDPQQPSDNKVAWLVRTIDGTISILGQIFPVTDVFYFIESGNECNATISVIDGVFTAIAIKEGSGEYFLRWAESLGGDLLQVVNDANERALLCSWMQNRQIRYVPEVHSVGADVYSFCAVACLLAHELGHVYEQQFTAKFIKDAESDGRAALINHGTEFAADYWSIWAAADVLRPFIDRALKAAYQEDQVLACKRLLSTLVLSAFACVEPIALNDQWAPATPSNHKDTHPVAAARLLNAAVVLIEWWTQRAGENDIRSVSTFCIEALQRVLSASQLDNPSGGTPQPAAIELLTELLRRHDESANYFETVRKIYPSN